MFLPKRSKTAIYRTNNKKKLLKNHFWIQITIRSCSIMDFEYVEKIQNFSPYRLQDISVWSDKNSFLGPAKIWVVALHKVTFEWKNVQNSGHSLDSFFKESWLHAWKFWNRITFQIIWNCITFRRKIVSRNK